ncbi:MAG: hypothetical protein IPK59_17020 [Rhodospirillaceae bacterium]|nr:hypothetical protein [Rhodospirillaceae bacterium]
MRVRWEILLVLVGGAMIYLGHSGTAELIYRHLPGFLVDQSFVYLAPAGAENSDVPIYLIPAIGVGLALQASGILWSFCGGLLVGLMSPRRAVLSAVLLAGLFLLPFWWIKALFAPSWVGVPAYLAAASLLLAGAWLARFLRPRAARVRDPDMSLW